MQQEKKKLVYTNPAYEHVIFCMGELHPHFNFLQTMGQHTENEVLDDMQIVRNVSYKQNRGHNGTIKHIAEKDDGTL